MKRYYAYIIIVILAALAYGAVQFNSTREADRELESRQSTPEGAVVAIKARQVTGTILKIEDNKILFQTGEGQRSASFPSDIEIVKSQDVYGVMAFVPAKISELKINDMIMVYYLEDPEGNSYRASKISRIK